MFGLGKFCRELLDSFEDAYSDIIVLDNLNDFLEDIVTELVEEKLVHNVG